jgi:hypothetical protein
MESLSREMELLKSNLGSKLIVCCKRFDGFEIHEGFLLVLYPYIGIKLVDSLDQKIIETTLGFLGNNKGIESIKNNKSEILYQNDSLNYKRENYEFLEKEDLVAINNMRIIKFGQGHERDKDYKSFEKIFYIQK